MTRLQYITLTRTHTNKQFGSWGRVWGEHSLLYPDVAWFLVPGGRGEEPGYCGQGTELLVKEGLGMYLVPGNEVSIPCTFHTYRPNTSCAMGDFIHDIEASITSGIRGLQM